MRLASVSIPLPTVFRSKLQMSPKLEAFDALDQDGNHYLDADDVVHRHSMNIRGNLQAPQLFGVSGEATPERNA